MITELAPIPTSAETVLSLISQGSTLYLACEIAGTKAGTIQALARNNPDFKTALIYAREALADYYAHKLATLLDNTTLSAQEMSAQSGILRHLMACNNRALYGDKVNLEIEHRVPIAAALADARARKARIIDSTATTVPMVTTRTPDDNSHTEGILANANILDGVQAADILDIIADGQSARAELDTMLS